MTTAHTPVMVEEMLSFFADVELKVFFDATLGAGGHARAILEAHPEIEMFIGCDRDLTAIEIASKRLEPWKDKVRLFHGNHSDLDRMVESIGVKKVDGFFLI